MLEVNQKHKKLSKKKKIRNIKNCGALLFAASKIIIQDDQTVVQLKPGGGGVELEPYSIIRESQQNIVIQSPMLNNFFFFGCGRGGIRWEFYRKGIKRKNTEK